MTWRGARILVLVWQAAWFNALLPGHTRGAIVLPGTTPAAASCHAGPSSAEVVIPCCGGRAVPGQPTPAERAGCAVCFFAAHLTVPPAIDFVPADHGPREVLPAPLATSAPSLLPRLAYLGRGPPAGLA